MHRNHKVTIGIPVFNAEDFLKYAIQSVVNQDHDNWQLIVINDGSSDSSMAIAHSFKDDRILILDDGLNLGLSSRLNQIAELSETEYLFRMDADDIMHPSRISKQIDYLLSNPDIDVVGTSAIVIDTNNQVLGRRSATTAKSADQAAKRGCFIHPTIAGKTAWFKDNQYSPDIVRAEDFDLWVRSAEYSNFANMADPLLYYREIGINPYKKYLGTSKGIRKAILSSRKVGKMTKILVFTTTIIKDIIYSIAHKLNKHDTLVERRSIPLIDIEKDKYGKELSAAIRK